MLPVLLVLLITVELFQLSPVNPAVCDFFSPFFFPCEINLRLLPFFAIDSSFEVVRGAATFLTDYCCCLGDSTVLPLLIVDDLFLLAAAAIV